MRAYRILRKTAGAGKAQEINANEASRGGSDAGYQSFDGCDDFPMTCAHGSARRRGRASLSHSHSEDDLQRFSMTVRRDTNLNGNGASRG